MGVSTKGIIAGDWNDRVFEVVKIASQGVEKYTTTHKKTRFDTKVNDAYYLGHGGSNTIYISFNVCPVGIMLWHRNSHDLAIKDRIGLNFDCHNDWCNVYSGKKLVIGASANDLGLSIMKLILAEFPEYDRYLIPNDCLDEHTGYPANTEVS